ncbi:unnamed protein product [Nippostrongylus brasiliensis]|uniref:Protein C21orf2 (inferred by orthology to a human protein) n=1 Tax=Nippostrongylus brasiliensis TaxID=27835 RepID=A0A158R1K7_NIPBR|nr:unnamed protein product [Nippostrongylus brasiliensis]
MVCLTESTVYIRTKCAVEAVKKLNLCVNRVETLQSLRNCTRLVELYVRKNNIQSLTELEYLKDLRNLRVLWIDDNPCTRSGDYRARVLRILPQLTKLDDKLPSSGRTIVDTVMQPQMVSYGDASDEERLPPPRDSQLMRASRLSLMSQSMHPSLMTQSIYEPSTEEREEDWGDFRYDKNQPFGPPNELMNKLLHQPNIFFIRANSSTFLQDLRLDKIMSAVSVLLDELDADGLRAVIEQAQDRMKKRW